MKKWKIWAGIILVFIAGICIGAAGTGLFVRHAIRSILREGPPAVTRLIMKKLTHDLDLSDRQQAEVSPIVRDTQDKLQELRLRNRPDVDQIISAGMTRIKGKLTPGQEKKLEALYEKLKERRDARDRQFGE